jgi:hypothetical protein
LDNLWSKRQTIVVLGVGVGDHHLMEMPTGDEVAAYGFS